tara:strand:+ start:1366 stop:2022 length:657 start_codon:yes stop_codon:yes gene_type:complete
MKKRIIFVAGLLILLTTINFQQKFFFSSFNLEKIIIENNILLTEKEIKKLLIPLYNKNLLILKNEKIEKTLMQNSFIEGFSIKKKYPKTLKIKIYEKKPIAIFIKKEKKFYLSENIDLIEFKELKNYYDLPYVYGNVKEFKTFYNDLKKIKFPFNQLIKIQLFDSNRWDMETLDNKLIRLPPKNYKESLENYIQLKNKNNFNKYKVFDYRINNQLILK